MLVNMSFMAVMWSLWIAGVIVMMTCSIWAYIRKDYTSATKWGMRVVLVNVLISLFNLLVLSLSLIPIL